MHRVKIKRRRNTIKKFLYGDLFLEAVVQYHQDSTRNPAPRKATPPRRKQYTSIIVARSNILDFHLGKSFHSQNNAFNKVIVRHNQLRLDPVFSP
jgi:hypothetical protein